MLERDERKTTSLTMKRRNFTHTVVRTVVLTVLLGFCAYFVYGLVAMFRTRDVSKMSAPRAFQWLVCDPIPSSVTNIKATGSLMFTGHEVELECDIVPSDFELVLARGNFVAIERVQEGWFKQPLSNISAPEFYRRRGGDFDSGRTVVLLTSTNHDRLFIKYVRP
jgi:hypothetical protein